jgi:hypothetical protein
MERVTRGCCRVSLAACGSGGAGNVTQMRIATLYGQPGASLADPNVQVLGTAVPGSYAYDPNNPRSNTNSITNSMGYAYENNVALPGFWGFTRIASSNCPSTTAYAGQSLGNPANVNLQCQLFLVSMITVPAAIDYNSAPSTINITNQQSAFTSAYKMPKVEIYDDSSTLRSAVYATSVSANGSSLTAPLQLSSSMWSGGYAVVIRNKTASGTYTAVGGAYLEIYNNDEPPPPNPCEPGMICE